MKKLLLLVVVVGAAYYGLTQFPQGRELLAKLPAKPGELVPQQVTSLLPDAPVDVAEDASVLPPVSKCITAEGEVIYGEVPKGTVCTKTETVEGALTVVPSRAITGSGSPSLTSVATRAFSQDAPADVAPPAFTCDGRTHCSQMTSCEEAKYFLAHCPGVEMDGNNDGEPCEMQWCQ